MRIEVVDLADERDARPVHDASEQMSDRRAAFPARMEAPEPRALDDEQGQEDRGQLATAGKLRPVMADHQQDRGAEKQHAEGTQRESQRARFRWGFRVTGEDALALFLFEQAFGIPSRRLVDQPIAETFGEGHGRTIAWRGWWGKGKGGG